MIEKSIKYEINIEKPSKTKPVKQGGVLNYLGKQKTVNAPIKWRSGPTHPETHLAYITKDEEKILIDLNIYKSMKNGKPNRGPFKLPSLNDGGNAGGDSGGDGGGNSGGSGGVGGSDASGNAGNATGDSAGIGGSGDTSGGGFGSGPGGESGTGGLGGFGDTFGSSTAQDQAANEEAETEVTEVDMTPPALQTLEEKAMAHLQAQMTPAALVGRAIGMAIAGKVGGYFGGLIGANIGRGVTEPSDYTQEQSSVQNGPAQTTTGDSGGINTLQAYAPLYNSSDTSGDPTMDAYMRKLRINLGLPV